MRGRSYIPSPSQSPPRGHGRRGRSPSPSPRGGGRYRARSRDLRTSLFVRQLSRDCREGDLRKSFKQFGPLKDIHLPTDHRTGYPRRFGFVQFEDPADAAEAKDHMDGYVLLGRKMAVEFAENNRKTPTEMRAKQGGDGRFRDRWRSSPPYPSRSPMSSRSPSPYRRRHSSRRKEGYDRRRRSYSRSPASNGSRGRSASPATSKSRSISRSPRRSISRSPRRRSISRSPRRNKSTSLRRRRSNTYTSEQKQE
ncbi:serine/arginine-rich SC35-like splicing factor SCL33 isoform X1 [Brassica rapa]|uniref:serine/arginine-rich SC35-like splicing factor SCL33 isoform X1 n=1 Tax=Brassica campestris TaxID=3711 RepID=UPI0004F19284|nr:serine/arginine-rich SC35-like splicing factor SCL33 isoform X1 [Brassica rapa]